MALNKYMINPILSDNLQPEVHTHKYRYFHNRLYLEICRVSGKLNPNSYLIRIVFSQNFSSMSFNNASGDKQA